MPAVAHVIRRRRQRKRRRNRETRRSAFWFTLVVGIPLALALSPLIVALGLSIWLYAAAASHFPTPQATVFLNREQGETRFFDESGGRLIFSLADPLGENHRWLKLEELPPHLISATLLAEGGEAAAEADGFHFAQALLQVWRYMIGLPLKPESGISGNLARDALLPLAMSSGLDASLLEIVLVAESKRNYSQADLLEWRLNSSYYGGDAFGIEAAAQIYLGKAAASLSLAESALLAAIVDSPAINPFEQTLKARERGADLLFRMLDAGLIDQAQFNAASKAAVSLNKAEGRQAEIAPTFIDYARKQAKDILESHGFDAARLMASGALRITTSLDLTLQLQSECVMRAQLAPAGQGAVLDESPCMAEPPTAREQSTTASGDDGALALIEVSSGKILSMVGDALDSVHQPALALQPFVYLEAFLRRDFTPASMVYDLPQAFPGRRAELIYAPANPDGVYRGPINLRDAMAANLLLPAVQVASTIGMEAAVGTAQALGFNNLDASKTGLDLLERGGAVAVLDTAYAYSVLASTGVMRGLTVAPIGDGFRSRDPVAILAIEDADGRVLWSYDRGPRANESVVVEPSAAYLVNDILADGETRAAVLSGAAPNLRLTRRAAVVDGISANKRDRWTVGYTPDLAMAVHTTRADEAPLSFDIYEGAGSARAWRSLMEFAHEQRQLPARDWETPPGIEEFLVCEISGLLPATTSHCPTRRELVPAGSHLQRDHYWQTFEINRVQRQLATVNTPDALRESRAYFIPPDDIMDWWVENGKPLPPKSYSTDSGALTDKPVRLTAPADFAYVGSSLEITALVNRKGSRSWQLEYGTEVNPDRWFSIGERQPLDDGGEIATTWETALFSGIYTLRLSVTFADGSVETDTKLLTFDNTPPAVRLSASESTDSSGNSSQRVVSLLADVSDNLAIERVEFFRNGALLGEDRDWPYRYEYEADGAGEIAFAAVAFDQVGNQASSELRLVIEA